MGEFLVKSKAIMIMSIMMMPRLDRNIDLQQLVKSTVGNIQNLLFECFVLSVKIRDPIYIKTFKLSC